MICFAGRLESPEQVAPRNSFPNGNPKQLRNPDQRHAVHKAQIAQQQGFSKLSVVLALDKKIYIGGRNQKGRSCILCLLD
jgi:hypothetical protein